MPVAPNLLDSYRLLREIVGDMLVQAQQGEWEALIHSEAQYLATMEGIKQQDALSVLTHTQREEKQTLLREILGQEAQTRELLEKRRLELGELIGNSRRQQALGQAYQAGKGNIASRLRSVSTEPRS
ncbi:flagellar protein FliT [Salinicola avicenniae]|uniref:flagellar protein FliT n=1 Tax=Salinicola avicenniae TaxID=2916836 RepID=UPI002073CA33|nr:MULTISPECIES: flagellar protein FliT [unclassified Salinicola]